MVLHAVLIFSVMIGILVSVRYKRFRPFEAFFLLSAVVIWSIYGGCPLTYLEATLRQLAGHPLPLTEIGFIPFYFHTWFNITISSLQLIVATYVAAAVFFAISIEWVSPYINIEIIKIRKYIKHHHVRT